MPAIPGENGSSPNFAVMLPCEPSQFRDFISGLLGKPQTIEGKVSGTFEIGKSDLINIHNLVIQRVEQQNRGGLLQFTSRIIYDDKSSVLLNSVTDFENYQEVKPLVSIAIHLSWTFLIQFHDKDVPEKQVIDLSFITSSRTASYDDFERISMPDFLKFKSGVAAFRIQHTARTWGADIQALLESHLKVVVIKEPRVIEILRENAGKISFFTAILILGLAFIAIWRSAISIIARQNVELHALQGGGIDIARKIDGLLDHVLANSWQSFLLASFTYVFAALVFSILVALGIEASTESSKPSFLLLSPMAERDKQRLLNNYRKKLLSFCGSMLIGVSTGILANILYTRYWT